METQARLIVDIARLDGDGETYEGLLSEDILELGADEQLKPDGPIHYRLFIEKVGSELLVRGSLELPCRCVCSRCATDYTTTFSEKHYVESFDISAVSDYFDLTDSVREGIILALPAYPVCQEACQGLCLRCGADLNESPCACAQDKGTACWSELDKLQM